MEPRDGGGFGPMMNHPYLVQHGHDHAGRGFGWLVMFIVLSLLIALVVWVVLRLREGKAGKAAVVAGPADNALEVLRLRYAQGEIDRREFLKISGDLGAPPEPPPAPTASPAPSA